MVTGGKVAGEEVEFGESNGGESSLEYKSDSEAAICTGQSETPAVHPEPSSPKASVASDRTSFDVWRRT